jgi:hypothetical protein
MDIRSLFDDEFLTDVRKDITYEVRMVVKTISEQVTNRKTQNRYSHEETQYYFSTIFYTQSNELGLTEEDAINVFTNGQDVKDGVIICEFDGYEIGIEYVFEEFSGKPLITAIWKQQFIR